MSFFLIKGKYFTYVEVTYQNVCVSFSIFYLLIEKHYVTGFIGSDSIDRIDGRKTYTIIMYS